MTEIQPEDNEAARKQRRLRDVEMSQPDSDRRVPKFDGHPVFTGGPVLIDPRKWTPEQIAALEAAKNSDGGVFEINRIEDMPVRVTPENKRKVLIAVPRGCDVVVVRPGQATMGLSVDAVVSLVSRVDPRDANWVDTALRTRVKPNGVVYEAPLHDL